MLERPAAFRDSSKSARSEFELAQMYPLFWPWLPAQLMAGSEPWRACTCCRSTSRPSAQNSTDPKLRESKECKPLPESGTYPRPVFGNSILVVDKSLVPFFAVPLGDLSCGCLIPHVVLARTSTVGKGSFFLQERGLPELSLFAQKRPQ